MPTPTGYTSTYTAAQIDAAIGAVPNKAEIFVYEIDCTNMSDGYLEINSGAAYTAIHAAYQAHKVVYVRLTGGNDLPNDPIIPLQTLDTGFYRFAQVVTDRGYAYNVYSYNVDVYNDGVEVYFAQEILATSSSVSGKADKVSSPTSGNFAALDSNGNLTDSGHKHSDYLTSFTETDPVFTASAAHGISSGDITAWNAKADKISIVSHGTSDTTFTLTPNVFHEWGTVSSLTLTLGTGTSYLDEYMFEFTSGSTATTLSLPNTVEWINGTPTIATNTTYQVSIVNNIAVIGGTA